LKQSKKISLYSYLLSLFIGLILAVIFGAIVNHQIYNQENSRFGLLGKFFLDVAQFPSNLNKFLFEEHPQVLSSGRFNDIGFFSKNGKIYLNTNKDDGYILLSSFDKLEDQASVKLIRVRDQKIMHKWTPNIDTLYNLTSANLQKYSEGRGKKNYRIMHPLPLSNGNIVFHNNGLLFAMNACSEIEFFTKGTFHHSNELDHEGNIWVPSVYFPQFYSNFPEYRDDAIAKISPKGEVLFKRSLSEILVENGYLGLLGVGKDLDPIHLNDIQPALSDSKYWKKGDLLISLRQRSTVFLYRPSVNKILWLSTGPWLNQHDANFVDNESISIFGNDVFDTGKDMRLIGDSNNIYIYNFSDNSIKTPFKKIMAKTEIETLTEGLAYPINQDEFFIEESNHGRLIKINRNSVLWELVDRINKEEISLTSWSRYLKRPEGEDLINNIGVQKCT